jgi:hypothetical protein
MALMSREIVFPSGQRHRCCMAVVSSCREVLGSVPQRAQPLLPVAFSGETAIGRWRKVGMMSSQHGPDILGHTHATMAPTTSREPAKGSQSQQTVSQFGLQAATRLHEAGVASNRESAHHGEYVPGSCTHRPSHHESRSHLKPPG